MDPFTQRMLERAEQRSKTLGITSATKFPLAEANHHDPPMSSSSSHSTAPIARKHSRASPARKTATTPQKKQHTGAAAGSSSTSKTTTTLTRRFAAADDDDVDSDGVAHTKENCDVALEINITTGANVQVQVEVEEREIDADGNVLNTTRSVRKQDAVVQQTGAPPTPQKRAAAISASGTSTDDRAGVGNAAPNSGTAIRDTSRNRLQRLGALYSDSEALSSPIHRNEARFDAETLPDGGGARQPSRTGKLAALANSIKTWEDESSSTGGEVPARKPATASPVKSHPPTTKRTTPGKSSSSEGGGNSGGSRRGAPTPTKSIVRQADRLAAGGGGAVDRSPAKQLKWDKTVMDSLEAQGFTRRESNAAKIVYDYAKTPSESEQNVVDKSTTSAAAVVVAAEAKKIPEVKKSLVSQNQQPSIPEPSKVAADNAPKSLASVVVVSKGLVSGRAALFETGRSGDRAPVPKPNQKDPAEMSLKDRLALFEKNKGTALVPKAAFGMSASQKQISGVATDKNTPVHTDVPSVRPATAAVTKPTVSVVAPVVEKTNKIDGYNKAVLAESHAAGNCIRSTVAALMNKGATISQSEIAADVRMQREREMNILMNRFQPQPIETETAVQAEPVARAAAAVSRPKSGTTAQPPPPPPPPPSSAMQQHVEAKCVVKRKSAGSSSVERQRDRDQAHSPLKAEAKRKRVTTNTAANRLYPVLSDIESTTATESDAEDNSTALITSEFDDETADDHDDEHGYENVRGRDYVREADDSYMASTDDDDDDNIANISLGREIMQAVRRNEPQAQRSAAPLLDTSTAASSDISSAANVTGDMDDYLDEALDEEDDDDESDDAQVTPRKKGSVSSNSFSFARSPPKPPRLQPTIPELHLNGGDSDSEAASEHKPIGGYHRKNNPIKSELRVDPSSDNNIVTLTHTVSFYRRQQASVPNTPVRKVTYSDQRIDEEPQTPRTVVVPEETAGGVGGGADESDEELTEAQRAEIVRQQVGDKVRRLLEEIGKQEQIISQTSQALNLCASTIEFSGSTESVEGERHLLVASHRRQAALNEVQRLRIERCLRDDRVPMDQGRLTVREITVPLRQEYKDKLTTETICGHQLVCLLKYNETVVATKTVPTLPGLLAVKFPDVLQMDGVYADFKITLEIYGMTAQRENVPHEVKYHINRKTPKGGKKGDASRLHMPPVQSPGGPGAVRTPALTQYGFVIFSLREIKRTNWTLNQASACSPLAGNVYMKANMEIKMHIDMRGFLTMFEDVSGFGAWHRRWCRLHNTQLSYWRYPDDEKTKAPIGTISLKECWTQKVQAVARDVCARQHTMELEIRRATEEGDRDSLVMQRKTAGYTVLKHLLSADTKEERVRWSAYFNKALILVRSWGMGSASGTFM